MIRFKQAVIAKEKFKALFWKKDYDKFNIITIHTEIIMDEADEKSIARNSSIKVYLFNINDAKDLPASIDDVDIKYLSVMELKEEKV